VQWLHRLRAEDFEPTEASIVAAAASASSSSPQQQRQITVQVPPKLVAKRLNIRSKGRVFYKCAVSADHGPGTNVLLKFDRRQVLPVEMTAAHEAGQQLPARMKTGDTYLLQVDLTELQRRFQRPSKGTNAVSGSVTFDAQNETVTAAATAATCPAEGTQKRFNTNTRKKPPVKGSWAEDLIIVGAITTIGALAFCAWRYWRRSGPSRTRSGL